MRASLSELEELVDSSGVASILETALPKCGRPRQLPARTLLLGMLLATCDDRPAHLTRVHDALVVLPDIDKRRLSVTVTWRGGDHLVTYRQLEHMTRRLRSALRGDNGKPSAALSLVVDGLLEASVPDCYKDISADLAVDWTDHETFARPASPGISPQLIPTPHGATAKETGRASQTSCSTATTCSSPRWSVRSEKSRSPSSCGGCS